MKEKFEKITEQCLCGSGKKYIECCKGKINPNENTATHKSFMAKLDEERRRYTKICLHPIQDECSETMAHAHSISQNAVLELIAEKGHVLMPVVYGITGELQMKPLGIEKHASKFYCFCSKHDAMFSDIDKRKIDLNKKNIFLYAYRSFAATYYKVIRELDCFTKLREKYDYSYKPLPILFNLRMRKSMPALERIKEQFNSAIISKRYDCLENIYITLDYKVHFAVSTSFDLMFDLFGNRLQYSEYDLPMMYISIIPQEQQTLIIFSWLKEDNLLYQFFKEQLKITPTRYVLKYLNNLIPLNCENMTVGPALWNQWSADTQNEFLKFVDRTYINGDVKNYSYSYFQTRAFNLFERI